MGVEPKIGFFTPQIMNFTRVFHYFHHPFWGFSPLFLETPIWEITLNMTGMWHQTGSTKVAFAVQWLRHRSALLRAMLQLGALLPQEQPWQVIETIWVIVSVVLRTSHAGGFFVGVLLLLVCVCVCVCICIVCLVYIPPTTQIVTPCRSPSKGLTWSTKHWFS